MKSYLVARIVLLISIVLSCFSPLLLGGIMLWFAVYVTSFFHDRMPNTTETYILLFGVFYMFLIIYMTIKVFSKLVREYYYSPCFGVESNLLDLNRAVNDVCRRTNIESFSKIILTDSEQICTILIRSEKILLISAFSLYLLSEEEVKSIVAHECGHYKTGEISTSSTLNQFNLFSYSLKDSYNIIVQEINDESISRFLPFLGPAFTDLRFAFRCGKFFFVINRWYSKYLEGQMDAHEDEFYCDSFASGNYGSNIYSSALIKMFDFAIGLRSFHKIKRLPTEEFVDSLFNSMNNIEAIKKQELMTFSTKSHPSLIERLNLIKRTGREKVDDSSFLVDKMQLVDILLRIKAAEKKIKR